MNKSLLKLLMVFPAIVFLANTSSGQNVLPTQPIPSLPSANAMNLGLFQEVPVSGSSGIPDITIPIYNIDLRGTNIPISLSYHASGVRADVHPSWVGLGWSLLAGGSINRVIKGGQDEVSYQTTLKGYYYNYAVNNFDGWSSQSNLSAYNISGASTDDWGFDREPDEFSFSFPGHSGKFFLDQTGTWRVQSDKPLKVTFLPDDFVNSFAYSLLQAYYQNPRPFKKFMITDEKGIKYVFGNVYANEDNIEYSDQIVNPSNVNFNATSWMLKQIISADGLDVIEFNYDRGPFQSTLYREFTSYLACGSGSSVQPQTNGQIISPVYLRSIVYARKGLEIDFSMSKSNELTYTNTDYNDLFDSNNRSGSPSRSINFLVTQPSYSNLIPYFNANPGDMNGPYDWSRFIFLKLDNISVNNTASNQLLQKVDLIYNNSSSERLRLSAVNFESAGANVVKSYGLNYYANYPLPGYLKEFGDHWGFYNNSPLPSVASLAINAGDINTYKAPTDLAHAITGTLSSITYPTGGSSTFEYEQNSYGMVVTNGARNLASQPGTAGGLRIKKIHTLDNNGNDNVRTYYYVNGFSNGLNPANLSSSGILQGIPTYNYQISGTDQAGRTFVTYGFTSSPVYPLTANSTGQHISYSQMAEQRPDNAYKVTTYTNNDNGFNDLPFSATWNPISVRTIPYNDRSFERGLLLNETTYTGSNLPLRSVQNTYARPPFPDLYAARAITQTYLTNCNTASADNGVVSRSAYQNYYYLLALSQQINSSYDSYGLNPVSVTDNYTWDFDNKLMTHQNTTNSRGEQKFFDYYYPKDGGASYTGMVQANMVDYKIQTVTSGPTKTSTNTVDYAEFPAASGMFYPQDVKQKVIAGGNEETVAQFNAYDQGNITQQTLKGGTIQSFEWGYNKALPIATVTNAQSSAMTGSQVVSANGVLNAAAGNSITFTTAVAGNITLSIQLSGAPYTNFSINYTLNALGSSLCFPFNNASSCGPNTPSTITYSGMPAGTYTLTISGLDVPGSGAIQAGISYTYQGLQSSSSGIKEFYCENFEESAAGSAGTAHTGHKYYNGASYQVAWAIPNPGVRSYVIDYWYLDTGNSWHLVSGQPFTSNMTLNNGIGYDDVRVYPSDALMTTYTYDPLVGMTSTIDPKGLTTYYEYDTFQRLMNIRDKDGYILKHMDYHYIGH